jgi:hypothetical protein
MTGGRSQEDLLAVGMRDGVLDDPLELPDVARPLVGEERLERGRRQPGRPDAGMPLEAPLRQVDDVLAARPQRRHAELERVEAVVEVLAELALRDERHQAAVGGHDETDVHAARVLSADALDPVLLQGPEQLGLGLQREIGDFVQEQRAALACSTLPRRPRPRQKPN